MPLVEQVPLQFLFPVHNTMKQAALAWRRRAREERIRQGLFDTDEEAFAKGRVLVRVSVPRARGLDIIAEAASEASIGGGLGSFTSPPYEEDDRQVCTLFPFLSKTKQKGCYRTDKDQGYTSAPVGARINKLLPTTVDIN